MKTLSLLLIASLISFCSYTQTIKMKSGTITATGGEDVIAFEASDSLFTSGGTGGGGGGTVLKFQYLKIKKLKDQSTNELWKRSISALRTPDFTFEFYDGQTLTYKIVIIDVSVNHFSFLSPECANCSKLYHQVWFDFTKIEVTDMATGITIKFNRATNAFYS